jgi:hypothetical protein
MQALLFIFLTLLSSLSSPLPLHSAAAFLLLRCAMERSVPSLRVRIGEEIVLRTAELEVLARDASGRPTIVHLRPQVRPGEILCERLGDIPMIVSDAEYAALLPPPLALDFDTWYGHRINVAHAKFMERTSYHPSCDWRLISPDAIERYINGQGV